MLFGTREPALRSPEKATLFQLVIMTYVVVCSGAYGLEEIVSESGPGLAIVVLLVIPIVYAAPMALACAELTARLPVEGGYYRWVHTAFGDVAGFTAGWLAWLTTFATNASFAVLFGHYLRYFVPSLDEGTPFISVLLVWAAVALNYRGIRVVGSVSVALTALIAVPFVVVTVAGLLQWRGDPLQPFANLGRPFGDALMSGVLIALWLYGGFEKMTINVDEIHDPVRAFPRALAVAVPLCAASYVLPTFAALAATGRWQAWGEAHFVTVATQIGGPWLGAAMAAGGVASNAGLLMVTLLGQSRLPMVLAEDGLFPRWFGTRHPRFGTPIASLVVAGVVLTALCWLPFADLVAAYAVTQCVTQLLIYVSLLRLRQRSPQAPPLTFQIPLSLNQVRVMIVPPALISVIVILQTFFAGGHVETMRAPTLAAMITLGPVIYVGVRRRLVAVQ